MNLKEKQGFLKAVQQNDLVKVKQLITRSPILANLDLRAAGDQDPHTNGFPLVQACKHGYAELAQILLESGADPNARSPSTDQREFGLPLCLAVSNQRYDLAHLLLDWGASTHAYPYCDQPMIEQLFYQARQAGVDSASIRIGFERLIPHQVVEIPRDFDQEVIRLYYRVLKIGVEPPISLLVRDENMPIINELLSTCPQDQSPKLSYPQGSILATLIHNASWYGYPQVMDVCMRLCPDLFSFAYAKQVILNGITSHNRDGHPDDYLQIVKGQLEYILISGKMEALQKDQLFNPFYELAAHFCWHHNYGYKAPPSKGEDMIRMAELFLSFGFDGLGRRHPKYQDTPLEKARTRINHPGMSDYVSFLS